MYIVTLLPTNRKNVGHMFLLFKMLGKVKRWAFSRLQIKLLKQIINKWTIKLKKKNKSPTANKRKSIVHKKCKQSCAFLWSHICADDKGTEHLFSSLYIDLVLSTSSFKEPWFNDISGVLKGDSTLWRLWLTLWMYSTSRLADCLWHSAFSSSFWVFSTGE